MKSKSTLPSRSRCQSLPRSNLKSLVWGQDEIGTPYCVTIDFDSLEHNDVTLRDRDTTKQERVKITDLVGKIIARQ